MPIGAPTEKYAFGFLGGGVGSDTISPTTDIVVGTSALLINTMTQSSKQLSSVGDNTGGNTWTIFYSFTGTNNTIHQYAICNVLTKIATTNTITLTYSNTLNVSNRAWIQAFPAPGFLSPAVDQSIGNSGTGNSFTDGPTSGLSQSDEVAIAVTVTDSTNTWFPSWLSPTSPTIGLGGTSNLMYLIVSATTPLTATAAQTNATTWDMSLVTLKGVPPTSAPGPAPLTRRDRARYR